MNKQNKQKFEGMAMSFDETSDTERNEASAYNALCIAHIIAT